MLLDEFIDKMKNYGIPLKLLNIHINEINKSSFSTYICKEEKWSIYEVDERNNADLFFSGDEDSAFEKLYGIVFYKMRGLNYRNRYITKEVIETSYDVVATFLKSKYRLDEYEIKETWDYLCQDFEVLNEFKYFVLNSQFVPDDLCVKRSNYSAKQIFESTYLEEIGAYNYLIYLKNSPDRAMERLKAGLPRK
jgi:hypothetical protein